MARCGKLSTNQLSTLNLHRHVHLPGFKPVRRIAGLLRIGEMYSLHARHDRANGGLVVNEAHRVGPTRDCIEPLWDVHQSW